MKNFCVVTLAAVALAAAACCRDEVAELNAQAEKEYLQPIRPSSEGRNPGWNGFSNKFIYAPAFDVPAVEGAALYRFTVRQKEGEG